MELWPRRAIDAMCQHKRRKERISYHRLKWLKEENMITLIFGSGQKNLRIVAVTEHIRSGSPIKPKDAQYAVNFLRETFDIFTSTFGTCST